MPAPAPGRPDKVTVAAIGQLASRMPSLWQLLPSNEARRWRPIALAERSPDPETRYSLLWGGDLGGAHKRGGRSGTGGRWVGRATEHTAFTSAAANWKSRDWCGRAWTHPQIAKRLSSVLALRKGTLRACATSSASAAELR